MNPVFKPVYLVLALLPSLAFALGQTTRVSVDANGLQGNSASAEPAISADGRYVAFSSHASNLVSNDTNNYADIFVKDRLTGAITRASISSLGDEANADSYQPWISADGKLVAFLSGATSLVADSNLDLRTTHVYVHDMTSGQTTRVTVDANGKGQQDNVYFFSASADGRFVVFNTAPVFPRGGCSSFGPHIFLHDRQTAKTQCISVNAQGADGLGSSYRPMISADGNFISFESAASNLVPGDTNNTWDIFVRNRLSGQITRASVNSNGEQGNNNGADHNADGSFIGNLSADGRFVVFNSASSNLVGDDTNDKRDMFVHDRLSGATTRVSVDSAGIEGNGDSPGNTVPWSFPSISADGRLVSFNSSAANLVANDTNAMDDLFLH
ncbi:MAG: hypothetical protein PHU14_07280, partial [Methylovulum sp.]|nr:hypothetical protein [Methylovulum sp.]